MTDFKNQGTKHEPPGKTRSKALLPDVPCSSAWPTPCPSSRANLEERNRPPATEKGLQDDLLLLQYSTTALECGSSLLLLLFRSTGTFMILPHRSLAPPPPHQLLDWLLQLVPRGTAYVIGNLAPRCF